MLDITLIENIYQFLKNLDSDGFIPTDINIKIIKKERNGTYYKKYKNITDFYKQNKEILDNNKPNRYCTVGDYCFLENIKIQNTISNYTSDFFYYNITSRNPKIRNKIKFDLKRNNSYDNDKTKYIEYLKESLISNLNRNIDLANTRLSNYVDACYVDINYVDNVSNIKDSIENDF